MADVELLPLPDWMECLGEISAANIRDYARANVEHHTAALRAEVSGLRAARIAYANEFPATEDGDPDTGNIHANIRALKARADDLAEALRELVDVFSESGMYDEEVFAKARSVLAANVTSKEN